jgi:hypothetical protein
VPARSPCRRTRTAQIWPNPRRTSHAHTSSHGTYHHDDSSSKQQDVASMRDSGGCSSICRCRDENDSRIVGSGQCVESIDDSRKFVPLSWVWKGVGGSRGSDVVLSWDWFFGFVEGVHYD